VNRLIAEGFLFERQKVERDLGRPPTLLALNPDGGRFIGVDFEAENLMATLVDFSQQPIRQIHKKIDPSESAELVIEKIERSIEELMSDRARDVLAIGVGVPGTIDPQNKVALQYEYIKGWKNVPLVQRLKDRFKVEVFLENNIRSMALAELWFGHGRGLRNFVCLGIRTGISVGIISGGRLQCGQKNVAGEMGEWLCPVGLVEHPHGGRERIWRCEELRPLEQLASVPVIVKSIRAGRVKRGHSDFVGKQTPIDFEEISQAAKAGDQEVLEALKPVAQTLGWVMCQISALLDPQKIILAGPLVKLNEVLLVPLREAVNQFCELAHQEPPQVVFSQLGEFNGALGAAALALHEWKPSR
jgi:predicted NBD/HSP70 family sugar kinase